MLRRFALALLLLALTPLPTWRAPAKAADNSFPATGAMLVCSGSPWIDVQCNGADPTDTTDSTTAIQNTINTAVTNNWPLRISPGKYKVSSQLTIDYAGQSGNGFRLISDGATLDGRSITSGPVLQVQCGGGTVVSPVTCFYFKEEGTLTVLANSGATNLATLTSAYSTGATTLAVSSTTPFYAGGTIQIALTGGGTFSTSVSAIGSGTITISPGLPSGTSINAQVSRPSYPFAMGKVDFSDQHNSFKIDHLVVNNAATAAGAGGCQFNAVYDSDIYAVCDSAGGAAGIALEQVQFTKIAGAGSANGTGGVALVMENGYNFSDTIFAIDLEVAPTCLSITDGHDGMNTFISPYFNCITAVNATGSTHNVLINPNYAGNTVNRGPLTGSIQIIGTGNRVPWQFPAISTFTAAGIDSGTVLSSYNATATTLAITLPAPGSVENGWWMGFATDNGHAITLTPTSGSIIAGGKNVSSITLGPGNYEYVQVQSDGSNYRLVSATRGTMRLNGFEAAAWPGDWLYPSTSGYSATLGDNGNVLSSYNTTGGLTITLPSTTGLPAGWSMGFTAENGKGLTINVNGTAGGNILYPLVAASGKTSLTLAGNYYEFVQLQYDGSGNFRVEAMTPATAKELNVAGVAGIDRWSFPSTNSYAAEVADNGNAIDASDSPSGYMAVTLPSTTALNTGWTLAVVANNGKTMAVQVNGTSGGHILYPGSGATVTSVSLAAHDYETLVLQYDGSGNFRVLYVTPATADALAIPGTTAGISHWSFPSTASYSATTADNGNAVSAFNAPGAGMTVTLPATTSIANGWSIAVATDNGKTMTVQVNGAAEEKILVPGTDGAVTSIAMSSLTTGYEMMVLQYDGSNYRVMWATPQTENVNGMSMPAGTPASSTASCITGRLQYDSNYLYICTAPNTWKRAAWSSF